MSTAASLTAAPARSRALHIALWVAQILLAVTYGAAGFMKSTMPIPALAAMMIWPGVVPVFLVRFIGVAELAGALGLILPAALRIAPSLTVLAGAGLALIQVLAIPFHVVRGEAEMLPVNVVLLGLSLFIVWGRWRKAAVLPR